MLLLSGFIFVAAVTTRPSRGEKIVRRPHFLTSRTLAACRKTVTLGPAPRGAHLLGGLPRASAHGAGGYYPVLCTYASGALWGVVEGEIPWRL